MFDTNLVSEFVVKNLDTPSPYGCTCTFMKFDDNWGIKVYDDKRTRDKACERQARMHKVGYAPSVGASFNIGDDRYCYITELAKPLIDCTKEANTNWSAFSAAFEKENPTARKDVDDLVEKMYKENYVYCDAHYGNFGMLNGKLVCIDFS